MAFNETTDLIRGGDMMLYVDVAGVLSPIAFATSNGISISTDTIDTSNKMSGKWKSFLPAQSQWTVSTEALISKATGHMSYDTLRSKIGSVIDVRFGTVLAGSPEFALDTEYPSQKGQAILTALDKTAESGGIATCSATLQGTGELLDVSAVVIP